MHRQLDSQLVHFLRVGSVLCMLLCGLVATEVRLMRWSV